MIEGRLQGLQELLINSKHEMRCCQNYVAQGTRIRSKMTWLSYGHKGIRYFFKMLKAKHIRDIIGSIVVGGSLCYDLVEFKKAFFSYYKAFLLLQSFTFF